MRIQTYLDESHSRHFDLVGGGDNPWSIDLVVEAVSCILLGGFIIALVAECIHCGFCRYGPHYDRRFAVRSARA